MNDGPTQPAQRCGDLDDVGYRDIDPVLSDADTSVADIRIDRRERQCLSPQGQQTRSAASSKRRLPRAMKQAVWAEPTENAGAGWRSTRIEGRGYGPDA